MGLLFIISAYVWDKFSRHVDHGALKVYKTVKNKIMTKFYISTLKLWIGYPKLDGTSLTPYINSTSENLISSKRRIYWSVITTTPTQPLKAVHN